MSAEHRLLPAEQIATQAAPVATSLHFPERDVFAERALRLRELAAAHPMRDYLLFAAALVEAQDAALAKDAAPAQRSEMGTEAGAEAGTEADTGTQAAIERALDQDLPPLAPHILLADRSWQADLQRVLDAFEQRYNAGTSNQNLQDAVARLRNVDASELDALARKLLGESGEDIDAALAPIVAAALQVAWVRQARAFAQSHAGRPLFRPDNGLRCPCCGGKPTASVIRIGGEDTGTRYLQCAWCQTQWHFVRIRCGQCGATAGIGYRELEAVPGYEPPPGAAKKGAVQVETCESCRHYLKLFSRTRDPRLEPLADDLATLTLDLLTGEDGYMRHGLNPLLWMGSSRPPPDAT